MENYKVILDISYYASESENVSGKSLPGSIAKLCDFPKELHFWGKRIARKLGEKNLRIGPYDHLYINYTTVLEPETIQLSSRDVEPWLKYVDFGVNIEAINSYSYEALEKFLQRTTFIVIKYLCENDSEKQQIIREVEKEIDKNGTEVEIECKRKETRSYLAIVTYKINPRNEKFLGLMNYLDKKSGKSVKDAFVELDSFEDIYPLVDSISVKNGVVIVKPRKSFKAGLHTTKYEVPIEFDFENRVGA